MSRTYVNAAEEIQGVLPVVNGGTGATSLTGLVKGNGSGAFSVVSAPSGTVVGTTDVQVLTNKYVSLYPGATTLAPLNFQAGTNVTTPSAGAVEYDGTAFYLTPVASTRTVVDSEQFITLTSAYTLTSQTAAQKLFNSTTNGAVTLPAGTYFFECFFTLSAMSTATMAAFGFALGGTATIAGQLWETEGNKAGLSSAASGQNTVNTAANTAIVTGTLNAVGWAMIRGKVRISAAGTLIPQVSLGAAAAAIVGVDSYFRIWLTGTPTVTNVGNWS